MEVLLGLGQVATAAQLTLKRQSELGDIFYGDLESFAKIFATHNHNVAASVAYRVLLSDILDRRYSKAYHHAARYYLSLREIAGSVDAWPDVPGHEEYISDLWDQHSRKRSFWDRVGGGPSAAD